MSWIKDIEEEQARNKKKLLDQQKANDQEFDRLDSMVRSVLDDVGNHLWGRRWLTRNYTIIGDRNFHQWIACKGERNDTTAVRVAVGSESEGKWRFWLYRAHLQDTTADTSEKELKAGFKRLLTADW